MKNYIKAELFRQSHIKSYLLVIGITILFPVIFAFYMKTIVQFQDVVFLGNHFLYIMYMYLLTGFYLVYPIVICAHASKPKYIMRQLLTSQMSKKELFVSDIFYTSCLNICFIGLHTVVSLICASFVFEIDNSKASIVDSLTVTHFVVMMGMIALTTIFANALLYCLQIMLENKVLSTGIFIFIIYIIPLIVAQLRFFSPLIEKFSTLIPFLQVMLYYKQETSLLSALIAHIILFVVMCFVFIIFYNRKED